MSAHSDWQLVLRELRMQVTSATFNAWFVDSVGLRWEAGVLVVGVRNGYAVDWLQARMVDVIERVMRHVLVLGEEMPAFRAEVVLERERVQLALDVDDEDSGTGVCSVADVAAFDGFEYPRANYVQIPHRLVDQVLPYVRPTVAILVLAVFRHTVGVVVGHGRKREWVVTHQIVRMCCNFGRAACYTAIWEARAAGLLKYRELQFGERQQLVKLERITARHDEVVYGLSPRWQGEAIDVPAGEKPRR